MLHTDPHAGQNPLLKAALAYASRGRPVLPLHNITDPPRRCTCGNQSCPSPGKHPRTEHGLKDATTDEIAIREWWQRWTDANVSLVTGTISGLVVLDVDPRHGGDKTLEELEKKHGALPKTISQITGGGGRHLFFKHPGGYIKGGAGKLGPGLDVRGDGNYIVVAPSLHISGNYYAFDPATKDAGLAELPGWLLEMLKEPAQGNGAAPDGEGELIPEGQRNDTLTSLAGSMRRRGMTEEEVLAALLAVNKRCCNPPLGEGDVKRIAVSVARYEPARDRTAPGRTAEAPKEEPKEKPRLRLYSPAELLTEENKELDWLINGILTRGGAGIVSGRPQKWQILAGSGGRP